MGKTQHIYTVKKSDANPFYDMVKMTADYEHVATYQMVEGKGGSISCTCPAYKPWHKHCDILRLFQAEERVNSGWFYNPETKTWIEPIQLTES